MDPATCFFSLKNYGERSGSMDQNRTYDAQSKAWCACHKKPNFDFALASDLLINQHQRVNLS